MGKELKFFKYKFAVHHYTVGFLIQVDVDGLYDFELDNAHSDLFYNTEERIHNLILYLYKNLYLSTTLNNFQINHIYH